MTEHKLEGFDAPKLEALVETMILAARADGEFSDPERALFAQSVQSLTDQRLSEDAIAQMVAEVERRIHAAGRPARLAAVKQGLGDPKSRAIALELAVSLMAADGVIRTSERELVMEVAEALEIDPDAAADMVARHHP
jgi:tellurite resistance protein